MLVTLTEVNMAAAIVGCVRQTLKQLDNLFTIAFGRQFPPQNLCMVVTETNSTKTIPATSFSLESLFEDGFLWAVPRGRRSLEKRMSRKFGYPQYVYKLMLPKQNLLICNTCGHNHEAGHLCPHCYDKVREETEAMQSAIQTELALNPVEQEVVVVYDGEKRQQPMEFWKGKRVIEMKKERPSWFSKNLLEKSTVQPSDSGDVKPTELA